ncbi:MAG: class D sortase [Ruminococcus sp.]|nr:class D sortase [Ruminococcus sp.]
MSDPEKKFSKKQLICFIAGVTAFAVGFGILSFLGIRKICREVHKHKLMKENIVVEIDELDIKAPVLEGTEQSVLSEGAGHFVGTGRVGKGNFCIAAHSSVIYKEYFNNLNNVLKGLDIVLYDIDKNASHYKVSDFFIVEPSETWVLDDMGDDRVTLITCTDDGTQRLVVVGLLEK